ncbi:MAG: hypothetical protein LQ346_005761 [Caloplaca aetnensis]|nr:MAG: hypothetical protein LQ346_005761 [Caloplaca aetnensis]
MPITDFFKPYGPGQTTKRPRSRGNTDSKRSLPRPRSNTPQANVHQTTELTNPSIAPNDTILISSQSSGLSSLHDSSPSTPEALPDPAPAVSDLKSKGSNGNSSFAADVTLSQVLVTSSSQRTVKNGEVIIRDSDEDRSDTDASLEDIDDLIGARKTPTVSSSRSGGEILSPPAPHATRARTTKYDRKVQDRSAAAVALLPTATPKYKFSLNTLVEQRQKEKESRLIIENAQNLLDGLDGQKTCSTDTANVTLDADLLATLVKDEIDGGNIDRLMAAIGRTEALDQQKTWSFFKDSQDDIDAEPADCPAVVDAFWQSVFHDPGTRQQAFMNGYIGECASFRKLPDGLLVWLLDAACYETRGDLHSSYCQALQNLGDQVTDLLTMIKCDTLLLSIGATPEALDLGNPAVPIVDTFKGPQPSAHAHLRRVLKVFQAVSGSMTLPTRTHLFCLLSRLLLDRGIVKDCTLTSEVVENLNAIINSMAGDDQIDSITAALITVYQMTEDLGLQLQLLRNFPARSLQTSLLRRRLALAFFLRDQDYLSNDRDRLVDFRAIVHHLTKPLFVVNNQTDYPNFAASIAILAIGVDDGDPPAEDAKKEAEANFNDNVDILARRIKAMFTHIVDTGASHMKRTEAKQALESFHACLAYAVRTKQKPRGMIWEDDTDVEKQKSMISHFVLRKGFTQKVDTDV